MIYIFIVIAWIAVIFFIDRTYKKKKLAPTLKVPNHGEKDKETVKITLAELSTLWERRSNKKYSLKIDELVPLYKQPVLKPDEIDLTLKHKRLEDFYNKYIKGNGSFTENLMLFVVELVKFIDENGDCPSVVKISKLDASKREFDLLSQVSLIDHSLDVAEEMIKLYSSPLAIPDAIAVSLSHDLGKIPNFQGDFYSTGDHPELSARIIRNELPSFKNLDEAQQNEILDAVIMHHKAPKAELGKTLIQADQAARKKEVQEIEDKKYRESKNNINAESAKQAAEPEKPVKEIQKQGVCAKTSVYDLNTDTKPAYVKPDDIDLSWFSPEEFISKIKPAINKVESGNRFNAFSMSNGYVYFMTGFLTDTAVEMGLEAGDNYSQAVKFETEALARKKMGHTLLNAVVNILRDRGMIPENLCGKKYFGNKFIVKYKEPVAGKTEQDAFYTPFLSSVFTDLVSELEKGKPDIIKNIQFVEKAPFSKTS